MAKADAAASRSKKVNSNPEEDAHDSEMDALPTPDSNQEISAPLGKGRATRGRPKTTATKAAKTKPASRRLSGRLAVVKKEAPTKKKTMVKRVALKEQTNRDDRQPEEIVDEEDRAPVESDGHDTTASIDELVTKEQVPKRGRPTRKQPEPDAVKETKAVENDGEFEYTPTVVRQTRPHKKPLQVKQAAAGKRNPSADPPYASKVIPETQAMPMDLDSSTLPEGDVYSQEVVPETVFGKSSGKGANSRQRQPFLSTVRAGNVSDIERSHDDPAARRRLEEMTKKLEDLDMRYNQLRDVGIKEAQVNFERLKEQSEVKTKAANDLVHALKKELATQATLAQESRSLQAQLLTSDNALSEAQLQVNQLTASLSQAQKENKALQAKLANSRNASVTVESVNASRTPGSAMKGNGQQRTIMVGSAEAAQAAQIALLKEDLYSDLTGLILRGVERGDEADVYDCIQTGRNGTLHFKLAVASDTDAKINYEDTSFTYTPRLDPNRDRDLLELLPDYLSEEIAFSRVNAAKFYGRVVDTLMKKRIEEEDGGGGGV